jgi:hypothetical protein
VPRPINFADWRKNVPPAQSVERELARDLALWRAEAVRQGLLVEALLDRVTPSLIERRELLHSLSAEIDARLRTKLKQLPIAPLRRIK